MQGEGDFVGMRRAPRHDAFELHGIVGNAADFHQLGFDGLWISHRISSMAHVGIGTAETQRTPPAVVVCYDGTGNASRLLNTLIEVAKP
jgi:hypothetical protein